MYKRFKETLIKNGQLGINEQKLELQRILDNWMKSEEQVDDILIMGLKV